VCTVQSGLSCQVCQRSLCAAHHAVLISQGCPGCHGYLGCLVCQPVLLPAALAVLSALSAWGAVAALAAMSALFALSVWTTWCALSALSSWATLASSSYLGDLPASSALSACLCGLTRLPCYLGWPGCLAIPNNPASKAF
jgi:hypothetical protein